MTFNWSQYLALAQELAGSPSVQASSEARERASISRSYYAAFCSARNHLRDADGDTDIPTGGVHDYVRAAFGRGPTVARKQIGSWLDHLWQRRVKADYFDAVSGLPSTASASLIEAQRVLDNLGTLTSP